MSSSIDTIFNRCNNKAFISKAYEHGIKFIIVGGTAVAFYGCKEFGDVDDLDLMCEGTLENGESIIKLLKSQGIPYNFTANDFASINKHISVKTSFYFDILTPPKNEINFNDLIKRSKDVLIDSFKVNIIALSDLIALTRIALEKETAAVIKQMDKISSIVRDLSCLESLVT